MSTINELGVTAVKPWFDKRNTLLDALFYDVSNLTEDEKLSVLGASLRKGGVLVVPPEGASRSIEPFASVTDALKAAKSRLVGVAVPGVGSSSLGAASLARTVANSLGGDVLAVICGFGVTDALSEALGGWFFYGYLDRFKHQLDGLMAKVEVSSPAAAAATGVGGDLTMVATRNSVAEPLDVAVLNAVLKSAPPKLKLIVGHSKGSLLIDYALEAFVRSQRGQHSQLYDSLSIVTVSAISSLPGEFKNAHQVIGSLDTFGGINSIPEILKSKERGIRPHFVQGAWHHLNTQLPFALKLQDVLPRLLDGSSDGDDAFRQPISLVA